MYIQFSLINLIKFGSYVQVLLWSPDQITNYEIGKIKFFHTLELIFYLMLRIFLNSLFNPENVSTNV